MTFTDLPSSSVKNNPANKAVRFIACLIIAAVFWVFNALSAQHESVIRVHLQYKLAENKINTTKLPETAGIQVVSSGWQILREMFFNRSLSIDLVNYSRQNILATNENTELFSNEFSDGFTILHISPDTLNLGFDDLVTKKIPVTLSCFPFKRNGYIIDSMVVQPDSIIIKGARSIVENIVDWNTERIVIYGPDTVHSGISPLKNPYQRNINMSAIVVVYSLYLAPAWHKQFIAELPTPGINNSYSAVTVSYDATEKYAENITENDFEFEVNYLETTRCFNISCSKFPPHVQNITIDPAFIYLTSPK